MILFGATVAGGILMATYLQDDILTHYTTYDDNFAMDYEPNWSKSLKECYLDTSYIHPFDYSALALILIHEIFIHPIVDLLNTINLYNY